MTGGALAAAYARDLVQPLLVDAFPSMPFSLARLGSGSDVLGFDDAISQDHDWGLRLTVVVPEGRVAEVDALLESRLPARFSGRPVRFATSWDPAERQRAEVTTSTGLGRDRAGIDAARPLGLLDHVSSTGQAVLEVAAGPVFRDDGGLLARLRARLEQPEDVRRWAIASAWQRIAEELPFVGRTGDRGDAVGSAVLTARLVRIAMHLAFLLEHRRPPYSKWLGSAFAGLPSSTRIGPLLSRATAGTGWREAEASLVAALEALASVQIADGLPAPAPVAARFWDRPFHGLRPVAQQVQATIGDEAVRALPLVGTPDLWSEDVRILADHGRRRAATAALLGLPSSAPGPGTTDR